jgi:hypothetical protein
MDNRLRVQFLCRWGAFVDRRRRLLRAATDAVYRRSNLRTPVVIAGEFAFVRQPILAAGGLSSPPGGLKGRLQARLPATRSAHIATAGLN